MSRSAPRCGTGPMCATEGAISTTPPCGCLRAFSVMGPWGCSASIASTPRGDWAPVPISLTPVQRTTRIPTTWTDAVAAEVRSYRGVNFVNGAWGGRVRVLPGAAAQ
eukprot:Amastigsp_a178021_123.p3 type:complete len:107 gc:universal Amastigsp_a178021_123:645-965(+)